MNISDKAKSYAEGKALESITNAIEKAFEDGYRQGYADRDSEIPEDLKKDTEDDEDEYVDLGLPSGTKWAKDFLKDSEADVCYLTYDQASKYHLPTPEQWKELRDNCYWSHYHPGNNRQIFRALGPNGNYIEFENFGVINIDSKSEHDESVFWMVDNNGNDRTCGCIFCPDKVVADIDKYFKGFKIPVRLVKNQ